MHTVKAGLLFLVFSLCTPCYGQFHWRWSAESGFQNTVSFDNLHQDDIILRMDGKADYIYSDTDRDATAELKVRPELFGPDKQPYSFRYRFTTSFQEKWELYTAGFSAFTQRYLLQSPSGTIYQDVFVLKGTTSYSPTDDVSFACDPGYASQKIDDGVRQTLDLYFLDVSGEKQLGSASVLLFGGYMERFTISNDQTNFLHPAQSTNKGFRYGPRLGFRYEDDLIVSCNYRFLFHKSDFTHQPSYEHNCRLMSAVMLGERFSVLLLCDLYWRKFSYNVSPTGIWPLIYLPFDSENKLRLKFGYDLSTNVELYINGGYQKERIIEQGDVFDSWNMVLGIEFNGI